MDIIIELIFDLLFECGEEICANKKVSKWIRYPIFAILIIFYLGFTIGIMALGIFLFKTNIWASLFCIALSLVFSIGIIVKFRKEYKKRNVVGAGHEQPASK